MDYLLPFLAKMLEKNRHKVFCFLPHSQILFEIEITLLKVFFHLQVGKGTAGKRQGDVLQDPTQKRRAAFGDITNVSTERSSLCIWKQVIPSDISILCLKLVTDSKVIYTKYISFSHILVLISTKICVCEFHCVVVLN